MTQTNPTETSIRGDVLTKQRMAHKQVAITPGTRGGIEFRVPSYLDVLFENDIITDTQRDYGNNFWSLKESALSFLSISQNRLYGDVLHDNPSGEAVEAIDYAEEGASTEIFLSLVKTLSKEQRDTISAACNFVEGPKMAIVWAFGVNAITDAFEALERNYRNANDDAIQRLEESKHPISQEEGMLRVSRGIACTSLMMMGIDGSTENTPCNQHENE